MKINKLVRDKIPEIIKKSGKQPVIHIADEQEYWKKLKLKLKEEVNEFLEDESVEEYADMLEVLEAISDYKKFQLSKINTIKQRKSDKKGKFERKIILEVVLE